MSAEEYEYIVVGSGAGGGPLAANLARSGHRVLLIEAGGDPESYLYQVPCFHPYSSEEKEMSWDYFVHHYEKDEQRDDKYRADKGGIFYPRAGTLGGCTAHNAMITMVPHDSDWDRMAADTGDDTWRASNMRKYFERLEHCQYVEPPRPGEPNVTGHGFSGWLRVSEADPKMAIGDSQIIETVMDAAASSFFAGAPALTWGWFSAMGRFLWQRLKRTFGKIETRADPNDIRNPAIEGITLVPLATFKGKRNGTREYIRRVQQDHPDRLTVRMNTLVTRVLFDDDVRAIGVECLEGAHLYRADPSSTDTPPPAPRKEYRCTREVILCGGAFNTPQLLMLSGIGPKAHLEDKGIVCLRDRPGVGENLQDRYEISVVSTMRDDFKILEGATFKPPAEGEEGDPCFQQWLQGTGVYTTNGAVCAIILRSRPDAPDPDLFIFGMPGFFRGYYPGYSNDVERARNFFTWAILKAHTYNRAGQVRLRSSKPWETPEVNFHYFNPKDDPLGYDLEALIKAVKFVRNMNRRNDAIAEEKIPGPVLSKRNEIADWITSNAWGHHASCSCRMGKADDPRAVVDGSFRVIGTKGLRIVDASVFPRIPGFFIVTPIYMISEKAADVILEDARRAP
jgi:choline dehydrogenase